MLQLIAEGNSSVEIAQALHISPRTVDTHRHNIMDKVNFPYRSDSHLPFLHVVHDSGSWAKHGLDVNYDYEITSEDSHKNVANGTVEFVGGNHLSPYIRRPAGDKWVYLGQTVSLLNHRLVVRADSGINRVSDLKGKKVADGLVTTDGGHHGGQLLIGELVQQVHGVLPCRQVIRCQHLHTVVMVRVHIGLIDAGDGHLQPLLLLRGQRAQIARIARHCSHRVLKA